MSLENIPATDLDGFIESHLLPDTAFRRQVKEAIDTICSFLKERCFREGEGEVRVSKVVKGGSSGKGTALKDKSDADLVVFLSPFTSFWEQFRRREEFIREIRRQLEACQKQKRFTVTFEVQKPGLQNPRALGFTLKRPCSQAAVEFDVLPAYDVLGQVTEHYRPHPDIYVWLIRECESLGKEGEFSSCFTELQRAFLKQRPAKLKSLIRLVKHWFQKCKEKLESSLPPQYALELLTVYAWERAGRQTDFITAQGFQTVLELVVNHRQLCIYWTQYYDISHPVIGPYLRRQLQKPRPVILDPADPTGNVGGGHQRGWVLLAREARAWMKYQCFRKGDGSPVGSWNIQA
ncbi:2'-5'-oligoadenylate synthase 1 isoform X1 [Eptesicus fuscus]|uniref:2'-5'-oligoadenylate synthase 1 isoform X1 n=1 Tax=Eptesicus fuscus TaxID=29078 RepID=UPI0024042471|nr:2'-5'-oligoadenylate synthase 1 isoform X1 [Eptesicus fuscus]